MSIEFIKPRVPAPQKAGSFSLGLLVGLLAFCPVQVASADEAGIAYGDLLEGRLPSAESTFQKMAKSANKDVAIKGEEGLAETEFRRGRIIEASQRIDNVLKQSPKRTMAHTIKAKLLYKQGRKAEAESELTQAETGRSDYRWQKAAVHTLQGNLYRHKNDSKKALAAYKQALSENPADQDALTNLGVTLQDLGQPEEAAIVFANLRQKFPADGLGNALLRQAQQAIAQKQDMEKQSYINQLVKDLIARKQQQSQEASPDDWTSPAVAVSILGFADSNLDNLAERAGYNLVLQTELTNQLQAANIKVVERAVLDKVVSELHLGASNLADPDAALKLGRILAARLMATGSVSAVSAEQNLISLRLIDTETTDIVLPLMERQNGALDPVAVSGKFARAIADAIKAKYPMKGRIAGVDGDSVIINLGKKHNITPGMKFEILGEDAQTVELNGKILGSHQSKAGQLVVSKVEDLMSYAQASRTSGTLEKNQKIIQAQ